MRKSSNFNKLPNGRASTSITKGCLVIEGGAFRGIYAQGVADFLMEQELNFECTVGCSAGALTGMNYVSGQIGRSININLTYRHDSRYVGFKAMVHNKGLIGFDFVLNRVNQFYPFDKQRFLSKDRRFIATTTDIKTGRPCYFDKDTSLDYALTIKASASMPFISKPVIIGDSLYLDGGIVDSIPYRWAIDQGYKKIIVIRTRETSYRKNVKKNNKLLSHSNLLKQYPALKQAMKNRPAMYNKQCDDLTQLVEDRKVFCISPSVPVNVGRLEGNIAKLENLYWLGYQDAQHFFPDLNDYLYKS
ncbi:patatin-like phospholipase family protein [Candidatus Enterococcus courvalinii]|uniref:patatin-like phospholipase family protein n=1 Tax=Candidatus Enterococcus courvalinii TaxID=2815329 RepID=UPI001F5D58FF|nr:patatin family protein [Enterococcus sp. MSG2901]